MKKYFVISTLLFFNYFLFSQNNGNNLFNNQLDAIHSPFSKKRDSLNLCLKLSFDNLKKETESENKLKIQLKIDELNILNDKNNDRELLAELDFIEANLTNEKILTILKGKILRQEGERNFESIEKVFDKISIDLKNTDEGNHIYKTIQNKKNNGIGLTIPNFSLPDLKNNLVNLNDIYSKNELVLVNFWASWCQPCIDEFNILKKLYSNFSKYGLEIISLSEDKDLNDWQKAVLKYQIDGWIHINTSKTNINFNEVYFRNAIPTVILVNKKGIIVNRWRGGGEENKQQIQQFISDFFIKKDKL